MSTFRERYIARARAEGGPCYWCDFELDRSGIVFGDGGAGSCPHDWSLDDFYDEHGCSLDDDGWVPHVYNVEFADIDVPWERGDDEIELAAGEHGDETRWLDWDPTILERPYSGGLLGHLRFSLEHAQRRASEVTE